LNLRSIKAIGYDLDYTLVHYNPVEWERRAYEHTRDRLLERGWPVGDLEFDPDQVIQGLTIDLELGNLLKVTRFGYVIRAMHGTKRHQFSQLRRTYAGTVVDLAEDRWVFLNTMFSMSEAALFAQIVDLADQGLIPEVMGYEDLYRTVRDSLDDAHMEGTLKAEILADPARFVEPDPRVPRTLLDQKAAGKRLMLITNSDWDYARRIMEYAFDPYLGDGMSWRDLFDTVIVSARKPGFFFDDHTLYHVVDENLSLLTPHAGLVEPGAVYFGGCARRVEESLGISGDEILYFGDHLFGDVHASKAQLRWRTALILRELESEVDALDAFGDKETRLTELMADKETLEVELAGLHLEQLRRVEAGERSSKQSNKAIEAVRISLAKLDDDIAPLAIEAGVLNNAHWGLLMRSGLDKSLFARQVERYADVYTSRVSNFLEATPFAYLRAARASLPHEPV
ncbi:MAG: HAD-IG family 5'-nucleotidase, partial [Acidimicrobiia bacterium]|nr:HAD-IG family 5'-nucleotidase [Acidimicrobiia bacterium]